MGDSDEALGGLDRDGLGVEEGGVAGCRVARMADSHVAGELEKDIVLEDFGDKAHALNVVDVVAVGAGDSGRFLAAMLEGVKAPVGEAGGVGMVIDGHDAALFTELVEGGGVVVVNFDCNGVRGSNPARTCHPARSGGSALLFHRQFHQLVQATTSVRSTATCRRSGVISIHSAVMRLRNVSDTSLISTTSTSIGRSDSSNASANWPC